MQKEEFQLVFLSPPENFSPKMEVAACFLSVGDLMLFVKAQPHKASGPLWGIPGGKFEKGETPEQAVFREVKEETGIDLHLTTLKNLGRVYIRYPNIDFIYHMFSFELGDFPEVVIDSAEHSEYKWMTLRESLEHPLIKGEEECIHLVYGDSLKQ